MHIKKPIANKPKDMYRCYTGIADKEFDYFDLTKSENDILGNQDPKNAFSFEYFTSKENAYNLDSKKIVNPSNYSNHNVFHDKIWIRVSRNANKYSFDVTSLELFAPIIIPPKLDPIYYVCEDYETKTTITAAVLNSSGTTNEYYVWTRNGIEILGEHGPILTTNLPGDYSVTMYAACIIFSPAFTTVKKYSPYITINSNNFFDTNTFVNANVLDGSGDFEYQLDNGVYQDNNLYYNISSGEHVISARDKNGFCSPKPFKFFILDFPKFVTPNNDGYNDTWNIDDLKDTNPKAVISIFDRFGKLVKQISPYSSGWDGTINGLELPSTDYWFNIDYIENGISKNFSSHFALKR